MIVGRSHSGEVLGGFQCTLVDIGDADPNMFCDDPDAIVGTLWFASVPRIGEIAIMPKGNQYFDYYKVLMVRNNGVVIKNQGLPFSPASAPTLYVKFISQSKEEDE